MKQVSKVLRMCLAERWAPGRMTCAFASFCRAYDGLIWMAIAPFWLSTDELWSVYFNIFWVKIQVKYLHALTHVGVRHSSVCGQWPPSWFVLIDRNLEERVSRSEAITTKAGKRQEDEVVCFHGDVDINRKEEIQCYETHLTNERIWTDKKKKEKEREVEINARYIKR